MFSRVLTYTLSLAFSVVAAYRYEKAEATKTNHKAPRLERSSIPTLTPVPRIRGRIPIPEDINAGMGSVDSLCGYVSGIEWWSITCRPGLTCMKNSRLSVYGCCRSGQPPESCYWTSCIPQSEMSSCTGQCLSDPFIARCTNSSNPHCSTDNYSGFYNMFCSTATGFAIIELTYDTESTSSALEPSYSLLTLASTSEISSSEVSTSPSNISQPPAPETKPIGAIVGGTIGGLVVLAVLISVIVWMILKHKKAMATHVEQQAPTTPAAPQERYQPLPIKTDYSGNQPIITQEQVPPSQHQRTVQPFEAPPGDVYEVPTSPH